MNTHTQSNGQTTEPAELHVQAKPEVTRESGMHQGAWFEPRVDIYETADALVVTAEVPGVEVEDIDTDLRDNVLTLTARTRPVPASWKPVYAEDTLGHYQRQFRLGQQIDRAAISAQLENGVLTLTLPKVEAAKPRRIEVKAV
ncbi:MAG: Hsp20/alpha crystallin family protein [Myxococcota bacterium]